MILADEKLTLIPAGLELAEETLDYFTRNQEFLRPFDPINDDHFYTLAGQREMLAGQMEQTERRAGWFFYIRPVADPGRIVGRVALNNVVWGAFYSCFLGYKLDGDWINRGYMTRAVTLAVEWAFSELGLHRVEGNVMPRNRRSLRVLEKCGFQMEGVSPKYLKINGVWEDHIHMVKRNLALE